MNEIIKENSDITNIKESTNKGPLQVLISSFIKYSPL